MKSLILIISYIMLCLSPVLAQLKVDAGNDVIVCSGHNYIDAYKDVKIGGCPVASGGVEPYRYTWSGKRKIYPSSKYWLHASDILDDTTKSNPTLKREAPDDWFNFYLKVEDAANNVQYDSVKIRCSYYTINLTDHVGVELNHGDSVTLPKDHFFGSNFYPFDYFITPSHGLHDSTRIYNNWAKPDSSILYYLHVINPVGCVSKKVPYLWVKINPVSISNQILGNQEIQCYINKGNLVMNWSSQTNSPYNLTVTALSGQIIHTDKHMSKNLRLTNLHLQPKQIYVVSILNNNKRFVEKLMNN